MTLSSIPRTLFKRCIFVSLLMMRSFAGTACFPNSCGWSLSPLYGVELFPEPKKLPDFSRDDVLFNNKDLNNKERLLQHIDDWLDGYLSQLRSIETGKKISIKILALVEEQDKIYQLIGELKEDLENKHRGVDVSIVQVDQGEIPNFHQIILTNLMNDPALGRQNNVSALNVEEWAHFSLRNESSETYYRSYHYYPNSFYSKECNSLPSRTPKPPNPNTPLAQFTEIRFILIEKKRKIATQKLAA